MDPPAPSLHRWAHNPSGVSGMVPGPGGEYDKPRSCLWELKVSKWVSEIPTTRSCRPHLGVIVKCGGSREEEGDGISG